MNLKDKRLWIVILIVISIFIVVLFFPKYPENQCYQKGDSCCINDNCNTAKVFCDFNSTPKFLGCDPKDCTPIVPCEPICKEDSDCVLTYIKVAFPCNLCDLSDPNYQCVSLEYSDYIWNKTMEKYGPIACEPCAPPTKAFYCICKDGFCVKTSRSLIG
ncbi:MAG: hypothetical protein JSW73_03735 [Candidatus Woesearchaeota archaeon]|nr:MAG: hypothetical protein JSW73_03735 [Candidatus Woesearchaeota archaeon]